MSISIEEAKYYTQAYVSKVQSVEPGEANETDEAGASETQVASIAPAPTSSPQLLSDSDLRLLLIRDVDQVGIEGYKGILDQYFSDPQNREEPVGFLENLSDEGIELLKQAQSFPESASIDVASLNKEEAMNFILPQSGKVDLNNDGLIAGPNNAKGMMFPPPNAPQSVKDAWEDATQNMSEKDKFLLTGKFVINFLVANIHVDQNGKVTKVEPGDPNWRNIYAEDGFSFRDTIAELKAGNEFNRPYNTAEIYEKTKSLLDQLDKAFESHGVA